MFKKIQILSLSVCAAVLLQACHDDSHVPTADAPKQVFDIGTASGMASLRAGSVALDSLFTLSDSIAAASSVTDKCSVRLHKMSYNTIDGAGGTTNSTGAVMVPYANSFAGDSATCDDPRPVVLYAHGTNTDRDYDLSDLLSTPSNPAATEAAILLAFFASKGYIVVAPNYAGYDDSALSYHPYLDEVQQSTEMVDALAHFKTHAANIGANMSSKLFVTGLSQGGYVAMAAHKALEAKGESVTASLPISGPHAMLDFLDTIMAGYVNGGATVFAPMYLTAAQKRESIYTDPTEVYSATYAANAEGSLPRPDGMLGAITSGVLPQYALFDTAVMPSNPTPALNAVNQAGFGSPYLLSSAFRTAYLADASVNGASPQYNIRKVVKDADLRTTWSPASPVYMCGSENDPIVYYSNSVKMKAHLDGLGAASVTNFNLDDASSGTPSAVHGAWSTAVTDGSSWYASSTVDANGIRTPPQPAGTISPEEIHGQTGVFCSAIAMGLFSTL